MSRTRGLRAVAVLAAALVSLSGCGLLKSDAKPAATASGTPVTGSPSAVAPASATPAGPGAALLAEVLPVPAGATPWKQTGVLPLTSFVQSFYVQSVWSRETALAKHRGFVRSARHGWVNADGSQDDVWLIDFRTAAGADAMYKGLTDAWTDGTSTTDFTVAAVHGKGQLTTAPDARGNGSAKIAAVKGHILIYTRAYTAGHANKDAALDLMVRQWARTA
jgi:hypothetical protein